ncbi:putative phage tail assembly chaperone [Marinomonas atlantica]|uniref:putative phage tail assembly chaperone n=1 Tax=Marinomonas atlantica TaxID=1806668 RepID=UPI000830C0C6|nr:putative phage tail assembly chaperone [Marinomonas atlantica]
MKDIQILVGDKEFDFQVSNALYNKFVDTMASGKAVQAGFNLLSKSVDQKQRASLMELIRDKENQPKATLVMSVVGEISEEMGDSLPEVVKLQKSTATFADETA